MSNWDRMAVPFSLLFFKNPNSLFTSYLIKNGLVWLIFFVKQEIRPFTIGCINLSLKRVFLIKRQNGSVFG